MPPHADRYQNDARVFVFHHRDSADIVSIAAQCANENKDQIQPYACVPAGQQALRECCVGDQPGPGNAGGEANQSCERQARAGAGKMAHAV
ncbi:hypothetical protein Pgy4_27920 [Pseudomonas savastanoi pv. glycinea str. race 4]|uniref:Uncharacterized protein n=1 Tax=Pseudomonas savastanoi pv. glycinea str. race 4 TaxID=875330 RepID=F3CC74_PSESG|nr:hypothetical protein Pgy4_27920 [Pseudomonas savastanoi pv. glycinea str. race 4]